MFIGEANIDGVTSFLFSINNKITGYKIINWHRYPLDNKELDELKKLQLSSNNKVIEDGEYKIILDLDSGFKHYFKDGKEDLMMFYQNNGEDYTLYSGKDKKSVRTKIGFIIYTTFMGFSLCYNLTSSTPIFDANVNDQNTIESSIENTILSSSLILPLSVEEMSNYINSSTRLNDEEKTFLDNELFFSDFLPYINKNQYLIEMVRQELHEIDIQCEEPDVDCSKIAGYNNRTNAIHIVGYNEETFNERKHPIAHEFAHNFHNDIYDFNYLRESTNEIITCEYFDASYTAYKDSVKITKCLMEIIGVEPILEYHICGNTKPLYDSLSPYLTEEEISLFTTDKVINDYTEEEKEDYNDRLKNVLEKLYYGMYGESMWDNAMINSIFNDLEYERYYFNSEKIKNTEMYASVFQNVEEYSIEEAIQEGYIHPYISETKTVSLEEWLEYDGSKKVVRCLCNIPNLEIYPKINIVKVVNEDGTTKDIPIKEAIESGIMIVTNESFKIITKVPTTDLDNMYVEYEKEENVVIDGDKVIVTNYKKEYFPPVQESANVLN